MEVLNFTLWVFYPFYRGIVHNLLQDRVLLLYDYHSNNLYISHGLILGELFLAYPLSHLSTLDSLNRCLPVVVLALSFPILTARRIVEADKLVQLITSFKVRHWFSLLNFIINSLFLIFVWHCYQIKKIIMLSYGVKRYGSGGFTPFYEEEIRRFLHLFFI